MLTQVVRYELLDGRRRFRRRMNGRPALRTFRPRKCAQILYVALLKLRKLLPALTTSAVNDAARLGIKPDRTGLKRSAAAHAAS